ncbi:MAG: hypothetical protein KL863_08655 [Rhizobium sp.]|nr:hypothetical protein [Rhizobium sp.]
MISRRRCLAAAAGILLSHGMQSTVGTAARAAEDWSGLQVQVGTYAHDTGLFERGMIAGELKALLGRKYRVFIDNMNVKSPLERDGVMLYASGNAPHSGGHDGAYIIIDTKRQAIEVGIWEAKRFRVYRTRNIKFRKPADIVSMIEFYGQ